MHTFEVPSIAGTHLAAGWAQLHTEPAYYHRVLSPCPVSMVTFVSSFMMLPVEWTSSGMVWDLKVGLQGWLAGGWLAGGWLAGG